MMIFRLAGVQQLLYKISNVLDAEINKIACMIIEIDKNIPYSEVVE